MADLAGETPVWADPSDGVPLWSMCREPGCAEEDCQGCDRGPWDDSGPTMYDYWESEHAKERSVARGENYHLPMTYQEATDAEESNVPDQVARDNWNLRLYSCAGCGSYMIRTGWWNRYHRSPASLMPENSREDELALGLWCTMIAKPVEDSDPVLAMFIIGGPEAVSVWLERHR